MAEGVLARQVGAGEVHGEDPGPLVDVKEVHRAAAGHAGRVDQDVDATLVGGDVVDGVAHRGLVGDVDEVFDGHGRARGAVEAHDHRALVQEPADAGLPETRGRAGHHRHPTRQAPLSVQRFAPH